MKQGRKGKQIWRYHFKSMHWGRLDDVGNVAPDLEKYAQGPLSGYGKHPGRDRSI